MGKRKPSSQFVLSFGSKSARSEKVMSVGASRSDVVINMASRKRYAVRKEIIDQLDRSGINRVLSKKN